MTQTKSEKVRSQLKHPVVDSDGHWLELHPVYEDYLAEIGGAKATDQYRQAVKNAPGYGGGRLLTPEMRMTKRVRKQGWWTQPVDARDRAAYTLPKLMHQSLDQWGFDVALIFNCRFTPL